MMWHKNIQTLIIDDADQHCELEQQSVIHDIASILSSLRHTILMSSTNTLEVRKLAKKVMNNPALVIMDDSSSSTSACPKATQSTTPTTTDSSLPVVPKHIDLGVLLTPADKKFAILYTFLQRNYLSKKVIVYLTTTDQVRYFSSLLGYIDVATHTISEAMDESQRAKVYFEFTNAKSGVLICTDLSTRGLKLPFVDFVFHYDCPVYLPSFARAVSRIMPSSDPNTTVKSIVLLMEENEQEFVDHLRSSPVVGTDAEITEYDVPPRIVDRQRELIDMVSTNFFLHRHSRAAYMSYMRHYSQFKNAAATDTAPGSKTIFPYNFKSMDIMSICRSYSFEQPPKIKD